MSVNVKTIQAAQQTVIPRRRVRWLAFFWFVLGVPCVLSPNVTAQAFEITKPTAIAGKNITFKVADGEVVYGTITRAKPDNHRILLLFHQAGANRHEYDPLISDFNAAGFDTLAIDQRAGGERWGFANKTVAQRGVSATYHQAYPDLEGALYWAQQEDYKIIITVGSSYSAALNVILAKEHPKDITAIATFSPGEYLDDADAIKKAAAQVRLPFYVTAEPNLGEQRVDEVLRNFKGDNLTRYQPKAGVHGASTLVRERNPKGYRENREQFMSFLKTTTK